MERSIYFWSEETILEALEQFIEKKGRLPTAREMNLKNGLPSRKTFSRFMGKSFYEYAKEFYPELVTYGEKHHKEAVLNYRKERPNWNSENLIQAEKEFAWKYGRLPEPHEYREEYGLPSYTIFCKIAEAEFIKFLEQELGFPLEEDPKEELVQEESLMQMRMM